jgi:hypothetical protein
VRVSISIFLLAATFWLSALVAPSVAQAAPNAPLCLAIQHNYNKCVRDQRRRDRYANAWGGPHRRHHSQDCGAWIYQLKANHCF